LLEKGFLSEKKLLSNRKSSINGPDRERTQRRGRESAAGLKKSGGGVKTQKRRPVLRNDGATKLGQSAYPLKGAV